MLRNRHLPAHRPPSRLRLAIGAAAVLACTPLAGPFHAAAVAQPAPQTPQRERLTIHPEDAIQPWTGDLDGMIERRVIRVLTVYSKTFYFVDKGVQRGANLRLCSPVRGGSEQEAGQGAEAEATGISRCEWCSFRSAAARFCRRWRPARAISRRPTSPLPTSDRQLVDFSSPVYPNVSEVVVSGPASPAVSSVDDLAGKEVFVRTSSSYYESLIALNQRFADREEACGDHQGGAGDAGGRGSDRDGERRPDSAHRRRQAQGRLLEAGLPQDHGARRGRGAHRRRHCLGDAQGQPAAQGRCRRLHRAPRQRDHGGKHDPGALLEEREVCEERCLRIRTQEIPRSDPVLPEVRRTSTMWTGC